MRQEELAERQFGAAAQAYLKSRTHAVGEDLKRLEGLARGVKRRPAALDLGCGAGHAAYALARGGAEVTVCDLSEEMLALVEDEADARGLDVRAVQCPAESLPFPDAEFDFVITRYSAHHWPDVSAGLAQVRRVLKPGGTFVVIDVVSPEEPLFDTVLQTVEFLRDASHVRDYRVSEWQAALMRAGFAAPAVDRWRLPVAFEEWVERMRTPAVRAAAARDALAHAPEEVRRHFNFCASETECAFTLDAAWMRTVPLP